MKNKYIASILAVTLGMFGVHKFYLNEKGPGIFYIFLYAMTSDFFPVSAILGFIDAIRYLTMDKEEFDRKFNNGVKDRLKTKKSLPHLNPRKAKKEYYEYDKKEKAAAKKLKVRRNPFKKTGLKKYKDFDIEEAIIDFEKGLKIQPKEESLHFHLAKSYSLLENKEKAFFYLQKAVENGFSDIRLIQSIDDLAYLRIQPEYEDFKQSGFKTFDNSQNEKPYSGDGLLLKKLAKLVELRNKGIVTEKDFKLEREKILLQV